MVVQIDVQPETEQLLKQELENGRFQSVDEVILQGIQSRAEHHDNPFLSPPLPTLQQRAAALRAWSKTLPKRGFYLPDEALERESFYGDRG